MWYITVIIIFVVIIYAVIWAKRAKRSEYIVSIAKNYCKKNQLQFLDDSVALQSKKMAKNKLGKMVLAQTYQFYCSYEGTERLTGLIVLENKIVKAVYLDKNGLSGQAEIVSYDVNKKDEKGSIDNVIAFRPRSPK